ncbi:MAG TPA: deoxyribodipyrimidine photo-lyase, partial [Chlamydiales bacterium]
MKTHIVWFRNDLRLDDHPALFEAAKQGPIIPLFIWSPEEETLGAAAQWWLHHALISLNAHLQKRGLALIVRQGKNLDILKEIIRETGAQGLFFNKRYEPAAKARDLHVQTTLKKQGIAVHSFEGTLLTSPKEILNSQGKPFQVFTPFWKACQREGSPSKPLPIPRELTSSLHKLKSLPIEKLSLLPSIHWDKLIAKQWDPTIDGAHRMLKSFQKKTSHYDSSRDRPDKEGTSRLSPYLHSGQISVRTVWHAVDEPSYQRQLYWRDFAHYLLNYFPHIAKKSLKPKFDALPWKYNQKHLRAWQKGLTGYPIVDAGMRELWAIGWMHNRVRMIVGSFLVKDLLIHWLEGANWFWDT